MDDPNTVLDFPREFENRASDLVLRQKSESIQPLRMIEGLQVPIARLNKSLQRYNSLLAFVPSSQFGDKHLQASYIEADDACRRINEIISRAEAECEALTESILEMETYDVLSTALSDDYWYTRADLFCTLDNSC